MSRLDFKRKLGGSGQTNVGIMNIPLFTIFCLVCLANVVQGVRISRYLRDNHPSVWGEFGFFGKGVLVGAKDEDSYLTAQKRLQKFLKSNARIELHDTQLDKMIHSRRVLLYVGFSLSLAVLITWLSQAG